jgi:hypothetical protein
MGCDYYISSQLKILFNDNRVYYLSLETKRGYFPDYYSDSDDDNFDVNKYFKRQKELFYEDKEIYKNKEWIKPCYEQKFLHLISEYNLNDILEINKIYNFSER